MPLHHLGSIDEQNRKFQLLPDFGNRPHINNKDSPPRLPVKQHQGVIRQSCELLQFKRKHILNICDFFSSVYSF